MTQRLVSVGDDFTLPAAVKVADGNLPNRLSAGQLTATYVPRWKASTAYLAGDKVVSPNGDVVSSIANHTSGTTFNAANWNLSPTIGTQISAQALPKWKANYAYGAGEVVLSPNNTIVAAKTAFTSGASFDASKWNLSKPDLIAGASGIVDPVPYRRWHAALANRFFAPAKWLRIGHSFTEGTGATALGNRWIDRSRDLIRQRFPVPGVAGGTGYLPPFFITPSITDPARSAGCVELYNFGPGGRCLYIPAGSELAIPNLSGTSIDIMFVKGTSTGDISWRIDSGATTTFVTADATAGSGKDGNFQRISLSAGTHTLTLGCATAGAAAYVTGIVVYNGDEAAGIQVYDAGHHGWKASDFKDNLTVAAGNGDMRKLWNINPDLVTIELGINEWTTNVAPATFDARLRDVIWYVKNSATLAPSIALILDYEDIGTYTDVWQTFVDITRQAALDNGCAVIDLNTRIESAKINSYGQAMGDGHPSNKGHSLMADSIVSAISPR